MKLVSYLIMFSFLLAACSTSKPTTQDSMEDGSAGLLESSADEVGSTPEDLLADEGEGGMEEPSADPFADLKENPEMSTDFQAAEESMAPSMAVEETSSEADALYGSSADNSSEGTQTYTVKAGDTLMKIAFHIYGDLGRWRDLHVWNQDKLSSANDLKRGMQLKYEAPAVPFDREPLSHSYVIKKGDTLANIADEVYGRREKYRKLQRYNEKLIKNPHKIFAGFTIFYEITPQEMAEAEARRREKLALQRPPPTDVSSSVMIHSEPMDPPEMEVQEQANPVRVPVATSPPEMVPSDASPLPPTAPRR